MDKKEKILCHFYFSISDFFWFF